MRSVLLHDAVRITEHNLCIGSDHPFWSESRSHGCQCSGFTSPQHFVRAACRASSDVAGGVVAQEADLLHMERTVLNSVGFRVNAPTAYTFWSIFRMSHAAADETSSLALYLTVRPAALFTC